MGWEEYTAGVSLVLMGIDIDLETGNLVQDLAYLNTVALGIIVDYFLYFAAQGRPDVEIFAYLMMME